MEFCYQKNKKVIYSEACPETKLRALAADARTKLHTDCCRLALKYAEDELPEAVPGWFNSEFMKFCKAETKDKGQTFLKKTNKQKLLLFADYEKGEHPFINFCARCYDETEMKDKKTGKTKKGPWRKQKAVHLSGLVAIDIDHVEDPRAIFERWQQEVDFKVLKIYFVYITPRGAGLRVVFRCEVSRGNLIDNQLWMCGKLGVEPDESCKDASRGYYLTSEENILFDNLKELYEDEPDEAFISKYEPEYRAGHSQGRSQGSRTAESSVQAEESRNGEIDTSWNGMPIQPVIDQWTADRFGGKKEVSRHDASLALAKDLYILYDRDQRKTLAALKAQKWVQDIIEERGEDVERTVSDAANYVAAAESEAAKKGKNYVPKPSKEMQAAIEKVTGKAPDSGGNIDSQLMKWGEEIGKLFEIYPCLREICRGVQVMGYPAAMFTGAAFLGTDMTRCWYHHYHRPEQERRLNYCIYVIGDPGSGKSFAGRLYQLLAAPIISSDKMSNDAINRYKKELKARQSSTKEQKKEPLKQPEVIVRCHGPRTANGVFIEDMNNAMDIVGDKEVHLHMLTFDAELDSNTAASKGGQWIDKSTMELKAFHNEEDSQQYKNVDSVTGPFDVFWNYVFTGTPIALQKKVTMSNYGSGLSTRLGCIPFPSDNKMMEYRTFTPKDQAGDELLKTWAYRLDKASGELPVEPIVRTSWEWTRDHFLIANLNEDEADRQLCLRVSYYGICVAVPFILMRHWEQWQKDRTLPIDDTDRRLSELIMDIQYGCQHHFFGEYARAYYDNKNRDAAIERKLQTKTQRAYNNLPETFKAEDVEKSFGTSSDYARVIVSRLVKDGFVKRLTRGQFKKTVMVA